MSAKLSKLQLKLNFLYKIFVASKWHWKPKDKCEILIYDATNAELINPYLSNYQVEILAIRGEFVYLFCLLRAAVKLGFWIDSPLRVYADVFISLTSPKLVITLIDNNENFFSISHRFPNVQTLMIQNGTRGEIGDIFGRYKQNNEDYVDWMLVHNDAIGRLYRHCIKGRTLSIGSLKNNSYIKSTSEVSQSILFISQYHEKPHDNSPLWIEPDGVAIYWDSFFDADKKIIAFLDKWCFINQKKLIICGRSPEKNGLENTFYQRYLKLCEWEFVSRKGAYSAYELVDASEIIVFIDSTLGYEALARGKKVAGFSCRLLNKSSTFFEFGWPTQLPNNGPFWTNDLDTRQFERIMNYLSGICDTEWKRILLEISNDLMVFDPNNALFTRVLQNIIPK